LPFPDAARGDRRVRRRKAAHPSKTLPTHASFTSRGNRAPTCNGEYELMKSLLAVVMLIASWPAFAECDPNYDPCVPIASDVDCAGGKGNGPEYVYGPITVIGDDIYGLDRDGDGVACE
jgi:hypothetical protein